MVTHPTTNLPIYSLYMGERTGSLVFCSLWSYVKQTIVYCVYIRQILLFNFQQRSKMGIGECGRRRRAKLERISCTLIDLCILAFSSSVIRVSSGDFPNNQANYLTVLPVHPYTYFLALKAGGLDSLILSEVLPPPFIIILKILPILTIIVNASGAL